MKNVEDIYELSPMQQGILFHSLFEPESGVYFVQRSWTMEGQLDISAFKQAWQKIVARHPILRTSFYWAELDKPVQVVSKQIDLPWVEYDWCDINSTEQRVQLELFLQQDRQQGFDLNQAPLFRFALIGLAKETYQFVWSLNHLLLDGWSMSLLFKEMLTLYEAFNQQEQLSLPRLRPYRDYIAWLQERDLTVAKQFWIEKLQGFCAPTPLVLDEEVKLPLTIGVCQEYSFHLSRVKTTALRSFAKQHRLTLNTIVQGVWALCLSRYSGETDVMFGATTSGRNTAQLPGIESMVGLFINTLPLRVEVNPEAEIVPWLQEIQMQQREQEDYSYTALFEIQQWSDIPGGMSLFDSIIVFENYPVDEATKSQQGKSIVIDNIKTFEQNNYPLSIIAIPEPELSILMSYKKSSFRAETIARMAGHFQTLLEGIIDNPQRKLWQLPIITSSERSQLLEEWNNTKVKYPQHKSIHQLFEEQVAKTPDAVAVKFQEQELTYTELNQQANQLAYYLQTLGVQPEVLVGICLERSLELIVTILAILKAGGGYVPLNPAYPNERLEHILSDSQAAVLITQATLKEQLPKHQVKIVYLDVERNSIAQQNQDNPTSGVKPDNLAYVIYTSGSTGKPKGVLVNHNNVTRLFAATESWYNFKKEDVWTLFHSYAFDFSVWELWGSLLYGGKLIIVPYLISRSPKDFYNLLVTEQVTVLNQTPAAFSQLIELEELSGVAQDLALRLVIFGGDALDIPSLRPWFERHGDEFPQLVNMYGITETTVHVTYRPLTKADLNSPGSMIGIPIPDLQIYILDRHRQLLPIGVPGEIYVGGAGVTRGYLNRPKLTKERFIDNPFVSSTGDKACTPTFSFNPDARLYRTGDLARYLDDGTLEYLGRIDNQVKIRGFRIELGEIEAALAQHPEIKQCLVMVREDKPGDKDLTAYIVFKQNRTLRMQQIRSFLQQSLPDYMIPQAFIILEQMPLTLNGKIERRALPKPEVNRRELDTISVKPQTALEAQIANIWQQVLKVNKVGIYDNFFDLGGHSLLVARVQNLLIQTFETDIQMLDMFMYPTIHSLAQYIGKRSPEKSINQPDLNRAKKRNIHKSTMAETRKLRQRHRGLNQDRGVNLDS